MKSFSCAFLVPLFEKAKGRWIRFWMRFAGLTFTGRMATRLAAWAAPPYTARLYLSRLNRQGYVDPSVSIHHTDLKLGRNVFVADRVVLNQIEGGGRLEIGDDVFIFRDTIIATGHGKSGSVIIGSGTAIQPRCQIMGYVSPVVIGSSVMIAPNCLIYSYSHGTAAGQPMHAQPLESKGGVVIEDGAWLGAGVIVLDGVRIGNGAVVGAGSVVSRDIPAGAIAMGIPAKVIRMRS
jgi:acetyltransferase-like isoleucine patch superfamily enzyme